MDHHKRTATKLPDHEQIRRDAAVDHHPHACWNGFVYLSYTVHDEEIGEAVEVVEAVPCRRCADR